MTKVVVRPGRYRSPLVSGAPSTLLVERAWPEDPEERRALAAHLVTYTAAFIPVLVWIGLETSALRAVAVAAVVVITHLVLDDSRLVAAWLRNVQHASKPALALSIAVDQSFHLVCLFGAALVAAN